MWWLSYEGLALIAWGSGTAVLLAAWKWLD
jgi:hypothetical protein